MDVGSVNRGSNGVWDGLGQQSFIKTALIYQISDYRLQSGNQATWDVVAVEPDVLLFTAILSAV